MSLCKGCYGDGLGHVPGVVLTVAVPNHEGVYYVMHQQNGEPTARCAREGVHTIEECGEFDPPRVTPDADPPLTGVQCRPMYLRDWDGYFATLETT